MITGFTIPQDIDAIIVRQDFEIAVVWSIPLIDDILYPQLPFAQKECRGFLVDFIP